jgi:hypothetical protein
MNMRVRSLMMMVVAAVAGLGAVGCDGDENASMRPGDDCLACHSPSGTAAAAPFSAGGTAYYVEGAAAAVVVKLTDNVSTQATAVSNSVGNFFFPEALAPPLQVEVDDGADVKVMVGAAGDCNSCHSEAGAAGGPLLLR